MKVELVELIEYLKYSERRPFPISLSATSKPSNRTHPTPGIPRTGLFSRNHVANLTQRNRVLQSQQNENEEVVGGNSVPSEGKPVEVEVDSLNSSFASLPRDQEGFDDLEAFFNRANTPKKTPRKNLDAQQHSQTASVSATPASHRKGANVLVAKPLKMISSKIAEHYKKEPRLAVSLSEVMALQEQEQEQEEAEAEELENDSPFPESDDLEAEEDRIQRAKRELEEMSIGNSFESYEDGNSNNNNNNNNNNSNTNQDHLDSQDSHDYVKSSLHQSTTIEMMPMDDDVLMDRLVEEMLVNDNDVEVPVPVEAEVELDTGAGVSASASVSASDSANAHISSATSTNFTSTSTTTATANTQKKQQRKPKGAGGLTRRPLTYYSGTETTEDGLRRSCRMKMEPLRYWANEKVCYGRAEDPSITLPVIVNVIKKPELDDPTFMMGLTRKRKRVDGNVTKLKAQAFGPDCDVEAEVNCYDRPGEEEVRLVALSHHHVQGDEIKDSSFKIHTIFTEGSYMSSGQLIFPPLSQKPTKNSSRHALVFYVISGSFRIEINRDSFLIGPGGQFHVPRANPYTITHVSEDRNIEGRLFFCHCKDNSEH